MKEGLKMIGSLFGKGLRRLKRYDDVVNNIENLKKKIIDSQSNEDITNASKEFIEKINNDLDSSKPLLDEATSDVESGI